MAIQGSLVYSLKPCETLCCYLDQMLGEKSDWVWHPPTASLHPTLRERDKILGSGHLGQILDTRLCLYDSDSITPELEKMLPTLNLLPLSSPYCLLS